jgi:hypothetical protein
MCQNPFVVQELVEYSAESHKCTEEIEKVNSHEKVFQLDLPIPSLQTVLLNNYNAS